MQGNNYLPPQNLSAERAILGACLLSSEVLANTTEVLKPEDFYDRNNRIAYEIMFNMYLADKPVDFVTFLDEAENKNVFEKIGGQPFLAGLASDITVVANAGYHASIVRERSTRRHLIEASQKVVQLAYKNELELTEVMSESEKIFFEASQNRENSAPVVLRDLTDSVFKKIQESYYSGTPKNPGYSSGFEDLDKIITGFQPGSLNIIAARPSMGKTALALNIAQFGGDIEKNNPVLIFSLEMSSEQLIQRMLSAQSGVSISKIATGSMFDGEIYKVADAVENLNSKNIYISESSELSAIDFRSQCRKFKMRNPDLALVVVDYLQLMSAGKKRGENRQYEVAEISRIMKSVAVELECPIIALSQLSRETEKRVEKKPQLSDLRDSGAIEQDADIVILLYRDDYYSGEKLYENQDSKSELKIAKNRNGKTGTCNLTFRREYTRFVSYAEDYR